VALWFVSEAANLQRLCHIFIKIQINIGPKTPGDYLRLLITQFAISQDFEDGKIAAKTV